MNAIQNARAPASAPVSAPEPNARNRQGAAETGADTFEQMLSSRPAPSQAGGESAAPTPPTDGAFSGVSTITLPQALADMLRGVMQSSPDDDIDDAPADEDAMSAPAGTALQPFPAFAAMSPPAISTQAEAAPSRTPQLVMPQAPVEDGEQGGEGDVAASHLPETGAARPERSSIMSTLDQALQAPRQAGAREDDKPADGSAQPKQAPDIDSVDVANAADDSVKVSFVSMSRSPAPVIALGEAAPVERAQAAPPPAPPPPPTAAAQQLRLVMEPSGLGAVSLNLSLSDSRVSVDLEAQRSETRHKLEAGRDQLVDSLTGAGYDVAHVQVKTASTEAGFDAARRDGAAANDAPSERAQQERDERSRGDDHEARKGDHADDPRARPHRSGGVFI